MKYDDEYLKTIYKNNTLEEFLNKISPEDLSNPRTRAIIGALQRSIRVLDLQFNPIFIKAPMENKEETNQPQQ